MAELEGSIAVLGLGSWGQNHLHTLADLVDESQIVGCDTEKERVRSFAEQYPDATFTTDPDTVLEDPDVDAVVIATPAPTHAPLARQAIEAGKDVLVEKPMTLDANTAEELTRLADREETILMVGHLLLYLPAIEWIRSYLEDGKIGEVHSLHQVRRKLGRIRENENVLWSFGVHDVAVFDHLVGEAPTSVQAVGQAVVQDDVEDDTHLHLTYPEETQAHLHTSWLWPEVDRSLTIVGSDGMLVHDQIEGEIHLHRKTATEDLDTRDEGAELVYASDQPPLDRELTHFLECVRTRQRPISDGRSGVRVMEILEEASNQLGDDPA